MGPDMVSHVCGDTGMGRRNVSSRERKVFYGKGGQEGVLFRFDYEQKCSRMIEPSRNAPYGAFLLGCTGYNAG